MRKPYTTPANKSTSKNERISEKEFLYALDIKKPRDFLGPRGLVFNKKQSNHPETSTGGRMILQDRTFYV